MTDSEIDAYRLKLEAMDVRDVLLEYSTHMTILQSLVSSGCKNIEGPVGKIDCIVGRLAAPVYVPQM